MARKDNAITFGAGFNITSTAPIDSRMLVEHEDDLISSSTWPSDKAPLYDGMTVTVKETGEIWVLKDITKYTDKTTGEGWHKSGGDIEIELTPQEVVDFLNEEDE